MISNILLICAMFFIVFGAFGINRFNGVIPKMLTSSLIDTMAFLLLVVALIMKTGFNAIGIRLLIVITFILLTTPVINHIMTSAAYDEIEKEVGEKND